MSKGGDGSSLPCSARDGTAGLGGFRQIGQKYPTSNAQHAITAQLCQARRWPATPRAAGCSSRMTACLTPT